MSTNVIFINVVCLNYTLDKTIKEELVNKIAFVSGSCVPYLVYNEFSVLVGTSC